MKKINMNSKGFTLIELLAVITIMGILMMVAIPSVTRTIENSRRDTYADLAKSYINTLRNSVLSDELNCGSLSVGATADGIYYYAIDSNDQGTKDLMESGGTSSWSNSNVSGYVAWKKTTTNTAGAAQKTTTEYAIYLVDQGKHGIDAFTKEKDISRAKVNTATTTAYTALSGGNIDSALVAKIKEGFGATSSEITQCKLK